MYISQEDMLANTDFSKNFDTKLLDKYIKLAEEIDLKQFFTDAFIRDLKTNYETKAEYITLLNGGEYTCGNDIISFAGLKKALCFFVYARLIRSSSIKLTQTGVVTKESDYSTMATDKHVVRVANENENIAKAYVDECVKYLHSLNNLVTELNNSVTVNREIKKYNVIGS